MESAAAGKRSDDVYYAVRIGYGLLESNCRGLLRSVLRCCEKASKTDNFFPVPTITFIKEHHFQFRTVKGDEDAFKQRALS